MANRVDEDLHACLIKVIMELKRYAIGLHVDRTRKLEHKNRRLLVRKLERRKA